MTGIVVGSLGSRRDDRAAASYAKSDPRVPQARRGTRRAPAAGRSVAPACRMGRPAGQHAACCAPVDPRTRERRRADRLERPVARAGMGTAVQRVRRRRAGPRRLHARPASGRRQDPRESGRARPPRARPPRARPDEVRRRRTDARGAREHAPLRRLDGHARHPVGGREATDSVDGSHARHRAGGGDTRARAPLSACLRPGDGRGIRQVGEHRRSKGRVDVRRSRRRADPGPHAGGRGTAARSRRGDHPRASGACGRRSVPAERRRLHAGHHERRSRTARPRRRATRRVVDAARVARRVARRREDRGHVAPRPASDDDPALAAARAPGARCGRRGGRSVAAPDRGAGVVIDWNG